MSNDEEIENRAKLFYFEIKSVPSIALQNNKVVFGSVGWRHIIWKGKVARNNLDKLRRIKLLKYAPMVVRNGILVFYREDIKNGVLGRFWKLEMRIDNRNIKVVIRQIDDGQINFFSIM